MTDLIQEHTAEVIQRQPAEKYFPWFLKAQNEGKVIGFALHCLIVMNQLSKPVQEYRQSLIRQYTTP